MFNIAKCSLAVTVALLLLGGCSTPEQRKQRAAEESARKEQQEQAQLERLRSQCLKYGFTPQSNEFARCVQDEMKQEQATASDKRKSDKLLIQCQQAMMLRSGSVGAGIANAGRCNVDPYVHLKEPNAEQRLPVAKPVRSGGTFLREYVSGWKKVCIYQRTEGQAQLVIESYSYCPSTIP